MRPSAAHRHGAPDGTLLRATGEHAAEPILAPLLAKFLPQYPDIKVEIAIAGFERAVAD